jgi:hypothetical protein
MALTDGMTPDEIAGSEARYGLHVTPATAEWLVGFAAGFKGSKADRAAFSAVAGAVRESLGDKVEPDADGKRVHALYLPLFDADGVSCEAHVNRVMDVLSKRSGRSKADKEAIAELREELRGASADMDVRPLPAPVAPVTVPDVPAPVEESAPVKAKRTRKAKAAPAPVAPVVEESAPDAAADVVLTPDADAFVAALFGPEQISADAEKPVTAPVLTPGDAVAAIAVKVGGMINHWSEVTEGVARMTVADRKRAAGELARDFAECAALQADADGSGNSLGSLDADANKVMYAARKILRNAFALLGGAPQYRGDRLTKTQRRVFRRAVAPWRADATAALPAAR